MSLKWEILNGSFHNHKGYRKLLTAPRKEIILPHETANQRNINNWSSGRKRQFDPLYRASMIMIGISRELRKAHFLSCEKHLF